MAKSFSEILEAEPLVLVDFFATWCGPCKAMTPILQDVKAKVGDRAKILKVDIDKNPDLANMLRIQGVPTLILYKFGKQVWRESGVISAFQLEQVISSNAQ